jgi:hypothetical protein
MLEKIKIADSDFFCTIIFGGQSWTPKINDLIFMAAESYRCSWPVKNCQK